MSVLYGIDRLLFSMCRATHTHTQLMHAAIFNDLLSFLLAVWLCIQTMSLSLYAHCTQHREPTVKILSKCAMDILFFTH